MGPIVITLPSARMFGTRRFTRFPINLRLRLQLPTGELETTTEDVSLAGFSAPCPELPEVGTTFSFVVHLPDGKPVSGTASAMRVSAEGLSGFSCEFPPEQLKLWEGFLKQEHDNGGLWRMLGRYALSSGDDAEAARAVLEQGRLGILFKRLGGSDKDDEREAERRVTMKLHMVGENGEAFRIAFEKHPSEPPEASAFAGATPAVLDFAKKAVVRVLCDDVYLRRSPHAQVEAVRLVEMVKGGFGFVVQHAGGKPGLMGLHGGELIVTEVDGKPVFPFFGPEELERISHDTFRREPDEEARPSSAAPLLKEERFSADYAHKVVETSRPELAPLEALREAMTVEQRVQTRTYGERTLRLFPDLWVEVRKEKDAKTALRGFAVEDGPALCVFVLVGKDAPRVVRLSRADAVAIIRGRSEG